MSKIIQFPNVMRHFGAVEQTTMGIFRRTLKDIFKAAERHQHYRIGLTKLASTLTRLDVFKDMEGGKAYNRSYRYLRAIDLQKSYGWASRECANCNRKFAVALHSDLKQCIMCDQCAPQAEGCDACVHRVACCHGHPPFNNPNRNHFDCNTCQKRLDCVAVP